MVDLLDPCDELIDVFGKDGEMRVVEVPGRVNLIGEHVDYHGLPVLPMALHRSIRLAFRARPDSRIRAVSAGEYGCREFEWTRDLQPVAAGDWENYIRAAAKTVAQAFLPDARLTGIDAAVVSDLPPAAGLSSSTALLVAFTLALLRANHRSPSFEELMDVLPDGEQFVGTRGGGMDHAAVLGSRSGTASLIHFNPVVVRSIPIPAGWGFLVAHSLVTAEKSGSARENYNARRAAGTVAKEKLGFASYTAAAEGGRFSELMSLAERLHTIEERDSFLHVTGEALRVRSAVCALERADAGTFGRLLLESHASLRERLHVSCAALDRLVEAAMASGALGARLTGAGFGGCAVVFCRKPDIAGVRAGLLDRFYAGRPEFDKDRHLMEVEPASGVLNAERK
jgi:galactokinase